MDNNELLAAWQSVVKKDNEDMLEKLDRGLPAREAIWQAKLDLEGDFAQEVKAVDNKFLLMTAYIVSFAGKEYFTQYRNKPIQMWWYHADLISDGKLTVDIENRILEYNADGLEPACGNEEKMREEGFLLDIGKSRHPR